MSTAVSLITNKTHCSICNKPAFCEPDKEIVFDVLHGRKIYICSSQCFKVYKVFLKISKLSSYESALKVLDIYLINKNLLSQESANTDNTFHSASTRQNKIKLNIKKAPPKAEAKEEKKS